MKEILNNEFANVSYDSTSNSVITVWKKPSTLEAYCLIFSLISDKIIEHNASAFICDIYRQGIVGTENRLWFQNEILPKVFAGGLRKIAVVSPNDVFSKFYVESVKSSANSKDMDFEFGYFDDLISAQAWVLNQEMVA